MHAMDAREGGRPLELPRVNGERARAVNKERVWRSRAWAALTRTHAQGVCTYDVCSEGGEPLSDQRKGGSVDLVLTRGGRGSKILEI